MRRMNLIKNSIFVLLALVFGLLLSCNVNEPETVTSIHLRLNDSLAADSGKYSTVKVEVYNAKDELVFPALFHGPYDKARDSAKLADLSLGSNPPNPMKVVITAYKGTTAALRIEIIVKDKKANNPILTILTQPTNTVKKNPEQILLSESEIILGSHLSSRRIYATLKPDSAEGSVTFVSNNRQVAEVDQEGNISPLDTGSAIITAHVSGNAAIFATVRVKVIVPPPIQTVTIKKPMAKLFVGAPETPLVTSHTPDSLTFIPEFESTNEDVIRIVRGALKAIGPGQAVITVRPVGITGVQDTVHLQAVKDPPQIDAGLDQSVAIGQPVTFKVKVTQEYGSLQLSWDFDEDQNPEGMVSTDTATATHTYNGGGDFKVVFTAKDGEGNVTTVTRRVKVGKAGPLILITKPKQDTLVRTPKFTVEYTADKIPGSQEFDLKEGGNDLEVVASNASGSDTVKVHVTLDTKAPIVKINSPAKGLITNLPEITVDWAVDLVDKDTRKKEVLTGKQGLIWILRDWTDSAGNWGIDSVQITRDTVPPTAPSFIGTDTLTNNPRPKWAWKPGQGGNRTYVIQFGSDSLVTTQDTVFNPSVDLKDGNYTLKVRERDPANNLSPWAIRTITVKITGPSSPTFNEGLTTDSPTNDQTPTWAWVSSGVIGGGSGNFQWSVNTPTPVSGQGTATQFTPPANLPDGSYTLTLREGDALGNWSAVITRVIRIQTTGAIVEITSPAPKTYTRVQNGVIAVEWQVNSIKQTGQLTHTLTTEGAWNLIRREFTDSAKNVTFDTVSVFWDTTAPPVPAPTTTSPTRVSMPLWSWPWNANNQVTFEYAITNTLPITGNGIESSSPSYKPAAPLNDGIWYFRVRARDSAQNRSAWSQVSTVAVKKNPPLAPIVSTSASSQPSLSWSWSSGGGGNGIFKYRWADSTAIIGVGKTTQYALSFPKNGAYDLCVSESDTLGFGPETCKRVTVDDQISLAERRTITVDGENKVIVSKLSKWNPNTTRVRAVMDLNFAYNFIHGAGKTVISEMLKRLAVSEGWTLTQYNFNTPGKTDVDDQSKITLSELNKHMVVFANHITDLGANKPPPAMQAAIEAYMDQTGGGMILHHGSGDTYSPTWPFYRDTLHPVSYQGHASTVPGTIFRPTEASAHPIMEGGLLSSESQINGEWHRFQNLITTVNPKAEVLIKVDPARCSNCYPGAYAFAGGNPISWVMPVGKGWVGYFQEGHDGRTETELTPPVLDRLFKQMIYYVAGYDTLESVAAFVPTYARSQSGISFDEPAMAVFIEQAGYHKVGLYDTKNQKFDEASGYGAAEYNFEETRKRLQAGLYFLRVDYSGNNTVTHPYIVK